MCSHRGDVHGDGVPHSQAVWQKQDRGGSWGMLGVRMLLIVGGSSLWGARGQRGADQLLDLSRRRNHPMLPPQPRGHHPSPRPPSCPGAQ